MVAMWSTDIVVIGLLLAVYWIFLTPVSWAYISAVAITLLVYL